MSKRKDSKPINKQTETPSYKITTQAHTKNKEFVWYCPVS